MLVHITKCVYGDVSRLDVGEKGEGREGGVKLLYANRNMVQGPSPGGELLSQIETILWYPVPMCKIN
jgi:hypothetical protein